MNNEVRVSFNALLALAFKEAEIREVSEMPSLEELNHQFKPSRELEAKIEALIAKEKRKKSCKKVSKRIKTTAASFVAVLALITCVFVPVQAVQKAVVATVIEWYDDFAKFIFETDDTSGKLANEIVVGYVPEGYEVIKNDIDLENVFVENYTKGKSGYIYIFVTVVDKKQIVLVDKENCTTRAILSNGVNITWESYYNGRNVFVWEKDGLVYCIDSSESVDEMLKIVQSLK